MTNSQQINEFLKENAVDCGYIILEFTGFNNQVIA
jgi:hypothetical protein